ncbi:hypothetical protein HK099_000907 [Clydaea vesicula]|uniref:Uncharacterized protein n=1 Tax=Clydaea vesicula TaxID=447962 RepID=A0AAD5Y1G0_9FUNG|nr:hypothetical protein HK099_000907 [Clydaea vesicula]
MSETFETNTKVTVQRNFIKKINTLITRIAVKQNYPPQIPRNLPDVERQNLKIERDLHINNLRERANIVRSAIFDSLSLPENLHLDDQVLTAHILAILPQQIIANGIPRDITTRPEAYLNSYIELSRLFEKYGLKAFNAIPLSTSTIPRYIIIDTTSLLQQILGITQSVPINEATKPGYWSQVFNLNKKAFRRKRGLNNELSFTGMIRTDLVGVSVNIGRGKKRIRLYGPSSEVYLDEKSCGLVKETTLDLLYCLGSNNLKLRYTQLQREKESKKRRYHKFRETGFDVMLLDEYRTSKLCPDCHRALEIFRKRMSPKPWKRNDEVTVHGGYPARLWNRDDVATLNQKSIVEEILAGEGRPARFLRAIIPNIPE